MASWPIDRSVQPEMLVLALPDGNLRNDPASPRLVAAIAGSLTVHAALLAALALVTGIGASAPEAPLDRGPLRATLASAPPAPVAPRERAVAPDPSAYRPLVPAPKTAPLPVPLNPKRPAPLSMLDGRASILPDDGTPVDSSIEEAIASMYPGAARGGVEFDVLPLPRYPEAARKERRQLFLRVPVVVKEDGSVEVAEGTFDDPLFGDAIREALAGAKAQPQVVDGAPRAIWTVLTFYFEFYASGESQRSKYEER